MDTQIALRQTRPLCLPALLLACCLPWQTQAAGAAPTNPIPGLEAGAAVSSAAPRSKQLRRKTGRMSKATLSALQPGVGEHLNAGPVPPAGSVSAALLSPVVQRSPAAPAAALADPALPTVGIDTSPETPLAKLLEPDSNVRKVSDKNRPLPSQEEGLALAQATSVPKASPDEGVSEQAEAKVEKGVESGPMRVRVRKQALQMSVEFPVFQ